MYINGYDDVDNRDYGHGGINGYDTANSKKVVRQKFKI